MKRADLVAGQAYYHDTSPRWGELSYGSKAVVVDTRPHAKPERWRHNDGPRLVEKGNGVLVDLDQYGTVKRTVVPLSALHGPYEETARRLGREQTARNRRARKAARERDRERERALALVDAARDRGVTADVHYGGGTTCSIQVDLDTFERLLNAAAPFDLRETS